MRRPQDARRGSLGAPCKEDGLSDPDRDRERIGLSTVKRIPPGTAKRIRVTDSGVVGDGQADPARTAKRIRQGGTAWHRCPVAGDQASSAGGPSMSARRIRMHRLQELVRLHRMAVGDREAVRMPGMGPNTERHAPSSNVGRTSCSSAARKWRKRPATAQDSTAGTR
jgi:hypothetical protein